MWRASSEDLQTRSEVDSEKMGYLGVTCQDVTSDIAQQYDMPEGVYLKSVVAAARRIRQD